MDLLHDRCAGLDVSKKDVKACVRSPGVRANQRHSEVRTFATTTNALLQLRDWLIKQRVTLIAIEATGDYWRPPFYLLEEDLNIILVNPAHAKGLPGRKSDVTDSMWLAQLAECGLLKASFVPPAPIRQLRDLTRYRTTLSREHTREAARLEKELEDAGIKISSVATDILGVSGRAMLEALIAGERDPQVLAQMARGRMRTKITPLTQALVGRFGQHHAFLCRMHLDRLDALEADIAKLSTRIEAALEPFRETLAHLDTIPGVGRDVAEVIIAETGADMSRFPTPGHLASWAGVAPGLNQSGERHKPAHTRHGDHWLTGALGVAAMAANRTKDTTFLGARYRRLARRIGKLKALVAIEHSILTATWHVLSENTDYHDLGGDYHAKRDPQRALRRITRDANRLGYTVRFDPIQAA